MATKTSINGIEELKAAVGQEVGVSDWYEVTQERINAFAEATEDFQWIHVDEEKAKDGPFQSMKVGFRGKELAAVEIVDSFGQRSLLQFAQLAANVPLAADRFVFTVPPGADVIEQ